jgi:hypothetical protein|tara:strand:- start:3264 stop:5591 length:2328 start_codon:yes stop_codon:yes gene_type:complete
MPKQFKTYTRFEGGLNTKTNSRSIQENELAQANNVIVDEFGAIKSCGKATDNTTDYDVPTLTASQPGYGLFQASFDFNASGSPVSTVRTFLADADDGTNAVIHIRDDGSWDTNDISLGAVTSSEQAKVIYHMADSAVSVCDTNINNLATTIKQYRYKKLKSRFLDSAGTALLQTENVHWQTYDTKLSKPTRGICGTAVVGACTANSTTVLLEAASNSFLRFNTQLDSGLYYAVNRSLGTPAAEVIEDQDDSEQLEMPSGGVTWSNTNQYAIYPPEATGFNLDFTVTSSGGNWLAGTYEFATTFVYDGNQESLLYELSGDLTLTADNKINVVVLANEAVAAVSGEGYPLGISGGRIYHRIKDSDDAWTLFGEIDFTEGTRPSLEGEFTHWAKDVAGSGYVYSSFNTLAPNIDTYESLNGFSPDTAYLSLGLAGERYQTSTVTNRRVFIANVSYIPKGESTSRQFGDQIRYSQINKFLTFPELNFIDIGVNDGESFVKLEAFADRLLAFKERKLYIINIGGGSDTQWFLESEHKNMGVEFHDATVKTDFGVAWVNKNGLFFYDGSRIKNLQTKILESQWSGFVNSDTIIGYEPTHKHLVIIRDAAASGATSGDAYVYSFITNSFTFVEDMVVNAVKSNVITDAYNKMTLGSSTDELESYDGEPETDGTTFDIILKDDDFGMPNVVKKIYGVTVEYASDNTNSNGLKYYYTNDSGTKQAVANGGDLADTNNDLDVNKVTFGTPLLASSFQVRLDMDGASEVKVNNVGVEYRPIHKKVT